MKRATRTLILAATASLLLAGLAGCGAVGTPDRVETDGGPEPGTGSAGTAETVTDPFGPSTDSGTANRFDDGDIQGDDLTGTASDPAWAEGQLQTVYFDFDQARLTDQARQALDRNADFLMRYPQIRIRISGHCDERGTLEYNLALGDRRAATAREYLTQRGVQPDRVQIVSYGEEQPADPGHSEAAWAKNRRAEFHVR